MGHDDQDWQDDIEQSRARMTICIAAACLEKGRYRIVTCADWLSTTAIGASDTTLKTLQLPKGFACLTSGAEHEILACYEIFKRKFGDASVIDETTLKPLVEECLRERRYQKCDEYIYGKCSFSYDFFLQKGKEVLPTELFREHSFHISAIKLDAEFVIAGFAPDETSTLIETQKDCTALIREDYAVAGSGAYLAMAALLNRGQNYGRPLGPSIYCVYEAKRYAENNRSVGKTTSLQVMFPKIALPVRVDTDKLKVLANQFKLLGPQPVSSDIDAAEYIDMPSETES